MPFKKILFSGIFMLFLCMDLHAQEPVPESDTLNYYQKLIAELQNRGLKVADLLQDKSFTDRLQQEGYSRDSLAYYYSLQLASINPDSIALDENPYIAFTAKSYRDSIVLRWGPSSQRLWQRLNATGYVLYRYEMLQDPKGRMRDPDTTSLRIFADTLNPLKPWTLERISTTLAESDTSAWIAAQALYGDSFDTPVSEGGLDFVSRNQDNNMRFGFSMLMADRSALAADLMGLRFVDRDVKPGKIYMYYLVPYGPQKNLMNYIFVNNDPAQNPKVVNVKAEAGDEQVKLSWPKDDNFFSGYWIERSAEDGKTWEKLTEDVIVFIEDDRFRQRSTIGDIALNLNPDPTEGAADYYVFVDSTANYVNYTYRISGQTPFADFSDYTFVKCASKDLTPPPMPQVEVHEVDEKTNIAFLKWNMDFEPEFIEDLAGFSVWEAPNPDSPYVQVSGNLPPEARSFKSPKPLEKEKIHYYKLKAVDKKGNETSTFPMYMHVVDDIPPAAPKNPAYNIDSTGVVTLVWEHNKEVDLLGYRVYFTNNPEYELTQLTAEPITLNVYRDTIQLVTLTEKIYYRIQAVDRSHNRSAFSAMIEVQRPDIIPPIAPVLQYPVMNDSLIQLKWEPSSSEDVVHHILYRRLYQKDTSWLVIKELGSADSTYTDISAKVEQLYEYSARAQDDAGLFSEYAFPVKGRRWFGDDISTVENLKIMYDSTAQVVHLSWQFTAPDFDVLKGIDYTYYIYRSLGELPLERYQILESGETSYDDFQFKQDGIYNYALKVVFLNGKSSGMTKPTKVAVKRK